MKKTKRVIFLFLTPAVMTGAVIGIAIIIVFSLTEISYATTDGLRTVDVLGRDEESLYLSITDRSEAPEFLLFRYDIKKNELYSADLYQEEEYSDPRILTEKMKRNLKPLRIIDEKSFLKSGYSVKCESTSTGGIKEDKIYFWKIRCIVEKNSRTLSEAAFPTVTCNQKVTPDYSFIDKIFQIDGNSYIFVFAHTRSMEGQRQEYPHFTANPEQKGKLCIKEIRERFLK